MGEYRERGGIRSISVGDRLEGGELGDSADSDHGATSWGAAAEVLKGPDRIA